MINLFGSNALLGTSVKDVFWLSFLSQQNLQLKHIVQKKFLVLFVTTYFATFEKQSSR